MPLAWSRFTLVWPMCLWDRSRLPALIKCKVLLATSIFENNPCSWSLDSKVWSDCYSDLSCAWTLGTWVLFSVHGGPPEKKERSRRKEWSRRLCLLSDTKFRNQVGPFWRSSASKFCLPAQDSKHASRQARTYEETMQYPLIWDPCFLANKVDSCRSHADS